MRQTSTKAATRPAVRGMETTQADLVEYPARMCIIFSWSSLGIIIKLTLNELPVDGWLVGSPVVTSSAGLGWAWLFRCWFSRSSPCAASESGKIKCDTCMLPSATIHWRRHRRRPGNAIHLQVAQTNLKCQKCPRSRFWMPSRGEGKKKIATVTLIRLGLFRREVAAATFNCLRKFKKCLIGMMMNTGWYEW